jgi:hypothetical protein
MNIELDRLQDLILLVNRWIDNYLSKHKNSRTKVVDWGFPRLSSYYSHRVLSNSYVVVVEKIETPPLHDFGLEDFSFFETDAYGGITYKDTYFISKGAERDESLHFHELIHVIQWNELGADEFLIAYGLGLLKFGYRDSPLEIIAYELQERFDSGKQIDNLETTVRGQCHQAAELLG